MNNNWKRFMVMMIAAVMLVSLAACGKKNDDSNSSAPEASTESASAGEESTTPEDNEDTTPEDTEASTEDTNGEPSTGEENEEPTLDAASAELADLIAQIYEKTTVVNSSAMWDTTPVDLSSSDTSVYFIGVGPEGVEAAVYSEPMMNVDPYSLCLIRVSEDADIDQMKEDILNGVDPIKWICVSADKVLVVNSDNLIMMVMANEEAVNDVYNAFSAVMDGNLGEKLERGGVE